MSYKVFNMNNIAKNIFYHLRILFLASTFYKNEAVAERQFT